MPDARSDLQKQRDEMTPEELRESLGLTKGDAYELIRNILRAFPSLEAFMQAKYGTAAPHVGPRSPR